MEVTDGIHALKIPFTIVPKPGITVKRFVYLYILIGEHVTLIDSGVAGCDRIVFDYLDGLDRKPQDITAILLTHAHPDHIGGGHAIQAHSGCRVWAHAQARPWIENLELQSRERPVPGFFDLVGGKLSVQHELEDGGQLGLPGIGLLRCLYTPGHSPGSVSFWLPERAALFTGDALCVGAGFPVYDDLVASWRSMEKLCALPDVEYLFGSWDKPRQGDEVAGVYANTRAFFERMHAMVRAKYRSSRPQGIEGLTREVIRGLGLPEIAAGPLMARAVAEHVRFIDTDLATLGRTG